MVILQLEEQPLLINAIISGKVDEVERLLECVDDVNFQDVEKRSPLHVAAFKGDEKIASLLLDHGARVSAKDGKWLTPLHRACYSDSDQVVSLLLRHGADAAARDRHWQTPLHVAAFYNSKDCVNTLLNYVPDINVTDRWGRTAMHHAAVNGFKEIIELLISKGAHVNASDKEGRRPLHFAVYNGHMVVIELLNKYGADINATDRIQCTPLHAAAFSGNDCAEILINCGADVNTQNAYGNTPLHIACLYGHIETSQLLVANGADIEATNYRGMTPLHISAASTHGMFCLNYLLEQKVNINKQSIDGRTPLHMTAIHGRFTRSEILINKGAIVDAVDKNGCTTLHIAAQYGHGLLSHMLLVYGADPNKKGQEGRTPLHISCLSGFVECARKLVQAGVDLNVLDDFNRTPVHYAAYNGSVDCMDLLVSSGANFQLIDSIGRTPLHYASSQGQFNCIFTLVGIGSNVNLADNEGCTALHLASRYDRNGRCVEYLLQHKADPKLKDRNGFTPIHYAVAGENLQAICHLLTSLGANYMLSSADMPAITPLHLAAKSGNKEILQLILPHFHDVNVRTEKGSTPLLLAAKEGHTHCVQMLLRFGAKVAIYDDIYHMSPVHFAAKNGHTHCLALLVDNTEDDTVIDMADKLLRTPLMLAVSGGHLNCSTTLLKSNANPNASDNDGHSSVFRAVVENQSTILQLLIKFGAQLDQVDSHGKTVLHLATACGHFNCLQIIIHHMKVLNLLPIDKQNCTSLHWACYSGNDHCLEYLLLSLQEKYLQSEEAVQAIDRDKTNKKLKDTTYLVEGNAFSPVHCAAVSGSRKCLELLYTYFGSEIIKLKDHRKRTPLHIVALFGHSECARYLIEQGADVNCQDEDGRSPLISAAQNGEISVTALLIENKADLTLVDTSSNTALHLACLKKHSHIALLLLDYINDVDIINMTNNERKTALHLSARNGLVDVTRQLILKGSSVIAEDADGLTPALCCAPNLSVAQCLAIILSNCPKSTSFENIYASKEFFVESFDSSIVNKAKQSNTSTHHDLLTWESINKSKSGKESSENFILTCSKPINNYNRGTEQMFSYSINCQKNVETFDDKKNFEKHMEGKSSCVYTEIPPSKAPPINLNTNNERKRLKSYTCKNTEKVYSAKKCFIIENYGADDLTIDEEKDGEGLNLHRSKTHLQLSTEILNNDKKLTWSLCSSKFGLNKDVLTRNTYQTNFNRTLMHTEMNQRPDTKVLESYQCFSPEKTNFEVLFKGNESDSQDSDSFVVPDSSSNVERTHSTISIDEDVYTEKILAKPSGMLYVKPCFNQDDDDVNKSCEDLTALPLYSEQEIEIASSYLTQASSSCHQKLRQEDESLSSYDEQFFRNFERTQQQQKCQKHKLPIVEKNLIGDNIILNRLSAAVKNNQSVNNNNKPANVKKTVQLEESLRLLRKKVGNKVIDRRVLRRSSPYVDSNLTKLKSYKRTTKRTFEELKMQNEQLLKQINLQLNSTFDVDDYCKNVIESSTQDLGVNTDKLSKSNFSINTTNNQKSKLTMGDPQNKLMFSVEHGKNVRNVIEEMYEQCSQKDVYHPSVYVFSASHQPQQQQLNVNVKIEEQKQQMKKFDEHEEISLEDLYLQSIKCPVDNVDDNQQKKDENNMIKEDFSIIEVDANLKERVEKGFKENFVLAPQFNTILCEAVGDGVKSQCLEEISSSVVMDNELLHNIEQSVKNDHKQACDIELAVKNEDATKSQVYSKSPKVSSDPLVVVDDVKILLPKQFEQDADLETANSMLWGSSTQSKMGRDEDLASQNSDNEFY